MKGKPVPNLTPNLHYATHLDDRRTSPRTNAAVDVQALANALPHGSGIDGDWHVTILRNGDVRIDGEYHNMNDGGYYSGWRRGKLLRAPNPLGWRGWSTFTVFLRRAKKTVAHALRGPCEGQVQVVTRKGDVTMTLRGGGQDLGDYLHECIHSALQDAGILPPSRSETISIDAAQSEGIAV